MRSRSAGSDALALVDDVEHREAVRRRRASMSIVPERGEYLIAFETGCRRSCGSSRASPTTIAGSSFASNVIMRASAASFCSRTHAADHVGQRDRPERLRLDARASGGR